MTLFVALKRSFLFWFGGIWLVCGLPFVIVALVLFNTDRAFARDGRVVEGMVLSKDIRRTTKDGRTRTTYSLQYRFSVAGIQYEGRSQLGFDAWHALVERGPVPITYLPSKPHWHRASAQSRVALVSIFGLVGAIFTLVGGFLFARSIQRARVEMALRERGLTVTGRVTSVSRSAIRLNGRRQWRLDYEFADVSGVTRRAHTLLDRDEAERWKVGDSGQVRFDAKRPQRSIWAGQGPEAGANLDDTAQADVGRQWERDPAS